MFKIMKRITQLFLLAIMALAPSFAVASECIMDSSKVVKVSVTDSFCHTKNTSCSIVSAEDSKVVMILADCISLDSIVSNGFNGITIAKQVLTPPVAIIPNLVDLTLVELKTTRDPPEDFTYPIISSNIILTSGRIRL